MVVVMDWKFGLENILEGRNFISTTKSAMDRRKKIGGDGFN